MPDAIGAYGLLPGLGPGRGAPRPGAPGRGEPDLGAPGAWLPWPGRGSAGRGPGTGPVLRGGPDGRGPDGAPSEGTGGTGARGAAGLAGPLAAAAGLDPAGAWLAAGAGGPAACGLAAAGVPADAGAGGRAGPGRGPGRPLPPAV